jgi:hypothetical protein
VPTRDAVGAQAAPALELEALRAAVRRSVAAWIAIYNENRLIERHG